VFCLPKNRDGFSAPDYKSKDHPAILPELTGDSPMPTNSSTPNAAWPLNSPWLVSFMRATGIAVSMIVLYTVGAFTLFLLTPLTFITTNMYPDGNGWSSGPLDLAILQIVAPGLLIFVASVLLARSALAQPDNRVYAILTAPYFFLILSTLFLILGSSLSVKTPPTPMGIFGEVTFTSFPWALIIVLICLPSAIPSIAAAFVPRNPALLRTLAATNLLIPAACILALACQPPLLIANILNLVFIGVPSVIGASALFAVAQLNKTPAPAKPLNHPQSS
jgi:hypothetical protein